MEVHLSADLEKLIEEKVESGRYGSPGDVIRRALLVLDEQEQALDVRATAFKAEIEERLASGPATLMDFSAVKKRIRDEVQTRDNRLR